MPRTLTRASRGFFDAVPRGFADVPLLTPPAMDVHAMLQGFVRGATDAGASAFRFAPPDGTDFGAWPAVSAIDESWYFKPDAGLLLGSPANADSVLPHDVVAEELDIALGIHNIESATTLVIQRPRSSWAGLRSFVPDGEPVCGFDRSGSGFFWAAALGGYGIQSAPGFGRLCAGLPVNDRVPAEVLALGLDAARLSPARLGV